MLEQLPINVYGDTKTQFTCDAGWQSEYEKYLAGYEAAEDKAKFNAEYFYRANNATRT